MITGTWTVPGGFPAAGTVRKYFIMIPASALPGSPIVLYQWSQWSSGSIWSVPDNADLTTNMLVSLGLYVAGLDQGDTFGAYRSEIPSWLAYLRSTYGVSPSLKPRGIARSRGGLFQFNLEADTSGGFFDRIVGFAPILDGTSYDPVGIAKSYTGDLSDPPAQTHFAAVPSVASPSVPSSSGNSLSLLQQNRPNSRTAAFVTNGTYILVIQGTSDTTVLGSTNIDIFAANYAASGGSRLTVDYVPGDHAVDTTSVYQHAIGFLTCDDPGFPARATPIFKSSINSDRVWWG